MVSGSVASIYLADRVMELVLGGYAVALSTAIIPLLARQAARQQIDEIRRTLNFSLRIVLFVTLPASVGLVLLRLQIIQVLFERGAFAVESSALTAWPLAFFAVGLSAFSCVKVVVPAFYALGDTRSPVWIAAGAMILNIGLNILFFGPLQNGGPALATSLAAFFNSTALIAVFSSRYGSLGVRDAGLSVLKFAAAALGMGWVTYITINFPGFYAGSMTRRALALFATIAVSAATYFGAALLLRAQEPREVWELYRARRIDEEIGKS
jgi:putative peptidoglycan lipid II flippase